MWSETIGLTTKPVFDRKIGLGVGLAGLVLCCETRSCYTRRHNDLEGRNNSQYNLMIPLNSTKDGPGTESPCGVQGRSPGRESGDEVPQKLTIF